MKHVLLYYYRKGKSASQALTKLCSIYGHEILEERQCKRWFEEFRSGNFSLKSVQLPSPAVEIDDIAIKNIIEREPQCSTRSIAKKLNISYSCVMQKLEKLNICKKHGLWAYRKLDEIHLTQRISICDSLLKRNEIDPFLTRLITGDERWITYSTTGQKKSCLKRKEEAAILLIWWDYKGILYFKLIPGNQPITSSIYIRQLDKLNDAVQKRRPRLANSKRIVFQHDNPKLHASLTTREKLLELGWDVLSHPPNSPDLAISNVYLFHSMQACLDDKVFNVVGDVKLHLTEFFNNRSQEFYTHGIMTLPERWQKVIDKSGQYIP